MIIEFVKNRHKYFEKVLFRKYKCTNSIQLVVYNLKLHTVAYLEDVSAELFEKMYCDSVEEIEQFLINNDIENEFIEFVEELILENVINSDITRDEKIIIDNNFSDNSIITNFYDELFENGYLFNLHIDVTNQCNLRCKHCYHPFDEYKYNNEMSLESIKKIVDEAYDLGVFVVILSGGEPLLRDDIIQILEYISSKDMCIDLFTNATLIDNDFIAKIKDININRVSISLYSNEEDTHDSITKVKGSYKKTISAIQLLKDSGYQVELKSVMMKENFINYKGLNSFAKEIGCKLVLDTSMTPKLNSDNTPIDLAISYEQFLSLCLDRDSSYYVDKVTSLNPNEPACNAGRYSLYCDNEGNFYPCVSFRLNLGNMKNGLKVAWSNEELKSWRNMKNSDYNGYNRHSYCEFCLEICAGISQLENGDYKKCEKSDCYKAKARKQAFQIIKGVN